MDQQPKDKENARPIFKFNPHAAEYIPKPVEPNIPPPFSTATLLSTNEIDAYIKLHADELKNNRKSLQPKIYSIVYQNFSAGKSEEALQILNSFFAIFYPNRKPFPKPVKPNFAKVEVLVDDKERVIHINKALDVDSQQQVVQKFIASFKDNGYSINDHDLLMEAFTYAQFGNNEQYFLNFYGYMFGGGIPMILLEYEVLGDLRKYITKQKTLPVLTQLSFMLDLVRGLMVLHEKYKIIHCDIKADNLFIKVRDDGSEYIRIGDFGSPIYTDTTFPTSRLVFTPKYASPEAMHRKTPMTFAHDVHCAGRTAMVMETDRASYSGVNNDDRQDVLAYLKRRRTNPEKLDRNFNPSDVDYKNLVLSMVAYYPEDRPQLKQIEQTLVQYQNKLSASASVSAILDATDTPDTHQEAIVEPVVDNRSSVFKLGQMVLNQFTSSTSAKCESEMQPLNDQSSINKPANK